jgi:hypothetical protein
MELVANSRYPKASRAFAVHIASSQRSEGRHVLGFLKMDRPGGADDDVTLVPAVS